MLRYRKCCFSGPDSSLYISAEGYVLPCCWLGNRPDIYEVQRLYGDEFENLHISKFKNAVDNFKKISDTWENKSFEPCVNYCELDDQNKKWNKIK
jgi:hypothetical protein|tara:strand:- start:3264 stop:3548 length:285 start_codon:yes stop_codon:yes gene_type:complete